MASGQSWPNDGQQLAADCDSPAADYAPSPNTSSAALQRAGQLRIQSLLRRLLASGEQQDEAAAAADEQQQQQQQQQGQEIDWRRSRIDTLRVLRKSLRELDFKLTWLAQAELLETLERLLRHQFRAQSAAELLDWRLVHDCTQLLVEALPRLAHELEGQTLEQLLPMCVQNLGHERSEVRRASLLLLNMLLNERPHQFQLILASLLEFGLSSGADAEAQRGAILSLPLLISEQVVARHDLEPLVRRLCELLVDSNEQLFYSLYLALQRLHLMLGDERFCAQLANCQPEAMHLYKQAASRSNSLVAPNADYRQQHSTTLKHSSSSSRQQSQEAAQVADHRRRQSSLSVGASARGQQAKRSSQVVSVSSQQQQHVTFESDATGAELSSSETARQQAGGQAEAHQPDQTCPTATGAMADCNGKQDERQPLEGDQDTAASCSSLLSDQQQLFAIAPSPQEENNNNNNWARQQLETSSSDVSSTCSSDAHLVNPAHYMSRAALRGRPMDNYEQIHHVDHSNVASLAINDFGLVCNTPTVELGPSGLATVDGGAEAAGVPPLAAGPRDARPAALACRQSHGDMLFGIFPRLLVQIALGNSQANQSAALGATATAGSQASLLLRHADRLEAMQELMCIVRESPVNHLAILISYFDQFLDQFLARLIQSRSLDHKLELIAVDMLETIVVKTKVSTMQFVRPIVSLLVRTLSDSRAHQQVFRAQSCRVLHKMMGYLPPQHVIDALFEHKHSRQVLVREEILNRVTAAVLEYERNEFNLTKLCYHALPMLADAQPNVRLAALECIATLAHALGPERIGSLLTAAEAVQTGCDYDGLLEAVGARLRRHALPRCSGADGSVRHVLRPLLGSSAAHQHQQQQQGSAPTSPGSPMLQRQQQLAADVRWVLEAPSSHQHSGSANERAQLEKDNNSNHHHHHHHRLGVYSPPSHELGERRRRRSSVGLGLLLGAESESSGKHHHHHHSCNHNHQRHSGTSGQRSSGCCAPAGQSAPPDDGQPQQQREKNSSETISAPAAGQSAAQALKPAARRQSLGQRRPSLRSHQSDDSSPELARRESLAGRRSNSQESISSSDTNKVLFQYYLGKFKQSLAEASLAHHNGPVLPSDSIIYSDIEQAYAVGRHQSRYQQTSFEQHELGPGEQVGHRQQQAVAALRSNSIGPAARQQQQQQRPPRRDSTNNRQQRQANERTHLGPAASSSGQRSPITPDTSECDSPQTVMEVSKERARQLEQQQQRDSSPGAGRRTSVTEAGKQVAGGAASPQTSLARASTDAEAPPRRRSLAAAAPPPQAAAKRTLVRQEASAAHQRRAGSGSAEREAEEEEGETGAQVGRRQTSLSRQTSEATLAGSSGLEQDSGDAFEPAAERQKARASRRRSASSRQRQAQDDELGPRQASQLVAEEAQEAERERELRRRASRSQPPSRASLQREQASAQSDAQSRKQQQQQQRAVSRTPSKQSFAAASLRTSNGDDSLSNHLSSGASHRRAISVSPSLACNVNIRHILENVAQLEGPFVDAELALKVALDAIESPCWSTKVEGIMAIIRLNTFHQQTLLDSGHLHELVCHVADETRNLRSTVARSAIFALGDLSAKLRRSIEPHLELIVQALMQKSIENTSFIRDDIRRSLGQMVDSLTHWRLANSLINHGGSHKSLHVRRMASQFLAQLVERMGAAKCLVGAKEISSQLIPAAARFAQDNSPFTRYYGRLMLAKLMQHNSFSRLLRLNLQPSLYRSTLGILESVKRRGPGELPAES